MTMQREAKYIKSISLSWWLSPPLQAYLDGQLYSKHNLSGQSCILSLLKDSHTEQASACQSKDG